MLFANCVAVKGASRGAIYDLQNEVIKLIPNILVDVLELAKTNTIDEVKAHFGHDMDEGIDRYISLLENEGYGFRTAEPHRFPPLSLEWDHPAAITNAIIDVGRRSNHNYEQIALALDGVGCVAVQFRFFDFIGPATLESVLKVYNGTRVISLELIVKYDPALVSQLPTLIYEYRRVRSVTIHGSPDEQRIKDERTGVELIYITAEIDSSAHCGQVSSDHFVSNIGFFTESQRFNTCLNRKISLDVAGNIKNCPSMTTTFGKLTDTDLKDVVRQADFKKVWTVTKEMIDVCKVCEFRHACTDCRAFVGDNPLGKPVKCGYDPHTMKWETTENKTVAWPVRDA
ncbi:MAG TPA: grasp-with-spasm system SPASM domain peptide maturase [Chryseosolibacter sp.]|nr:grasp-with-spasm system SPASM domain peptide maturase [Chryseosolibacter sp.]